jgi:hypothetical protein
VNEPSNRYIRRKRVMQDCPECRGSGEYVGLQVREVCRHCKGAKQVPVGPIPSDVVPDFFSQFYGGNLGKAWNPDAKEVAQDAAEQIKAVGRRYAGGVVPKFIDPPATPNTQHWIQVAGNADACPTLPADREDVGYERVPPNKNPCVEIGEPGFNGKLMPHQLAIVEECLDPKVRTPMLRYVSLNRFQPVPHLVDDQCRGK